MLCAELTFEDDLEINTYPEDLINLRIANQTLFLSKLFCKFDQLCESNQVYKVRTSESNYMVIGFTGRNLKDRRDQSVLTEETISVMKMALEMMAVLEAEKASSHIQSEIKKMHLKIGIHTGKVTGGIIGTRLVKYEIFGKDQLVCQMIKDSVELDSVVISESTMQIIQRFNVADQFVIEEGQTVTVQEKIYPTYQILKMANVEVSESSEPSDSGSEPINSSDEQKSINTAENESDRQSDQESY